VIDTYSGIPVIADPHMVDTRHLRHRFPRKFFERLLSWHPFTKYRYITKTVYIPRPEFLHDKVNNRLYAHPKYVAMLNQVI